MELILLWLSTILISYGVDGAIRLSIIKNIADQGYKLVENVSNEVLGTNASKLNYDKLFKFIPFANIFIEFLGLIQYNLNKNNMVDMLLSENLIVAMTQAEKEVYGQGSLFKALFINSVDDIEIEKEVSFEIDNSFIDESITIDYSNPDSCKFMIDNQPINSIDEAIEKCKTSEFKQYLIDLKTELLKTTGNTEVKITVEFEEPTTLTKKK